MFPSTLSAPSVAGLRRADRSAYVGVWTHPLEPMSLLFVVAWTAAAFDPDTPVDVKGVGGVKLKHAEATCLTGTPQGDVASVQGNPRVAAFQEVARGFLDASPEVRRAYFGTHPRGDWPTHEVDVRYVPDDLTWVLQGVVGSCEAAGAWWVREGIRIHALCLEDKKACRANFTDEEWQIVEGGLKLLKRGATTGRDPFFDHLNAHDAELEAWANPRTLLERACGWPQEAASEAAFLDRDDLVAARRACLQIQVLASRSAFIPPIAQACATPWREVAADAPFLVAAPYTDLGVSADDVARQLEAVQSHLSAMDPSPARCDDGWADVWRGALVTAWRDAQAVAACAEDTLALEDRAHLCPDLPRHQDQACAEGAPEACHVRAQMHLRGLGGPVDVTAGTQLLLQSCTLGSTAGCEALRGQAEVVGAWVDARLTDATPMPIEGQESASPPADAPALVAEAGRLVALYGPHLDPTWTATHAQRVVLTAVQAQAPDVAAAVLSAHEAALPAEFVASARTALDALVNAPGLPGAASP